MSDYLSTLQQISVSVYCYFKIALSVLLETISDMVAVNRTLTSSPSPEDIKVTVAAAEQDFPQFY